VPKALGWPERKADQAEAPLPWTAEHPESGLGWAARPGRSETPDPLYGGVCRLTWTYMLGRFNIGLNR